MAQPGHHSQQVPSIAFVGAGNRRWHAVEVAVNDTGLLHASRNWWLNPNSAWEVAFVVWRQNKLVRVRFEPCKSPASLKPSGKPADANHRRWTAVSADASNKNIKLYQAFARKIRS